jgi:acyl-CoA reductase-like NAD-dependent aldehyde dehydrogenase
MASRIFVQEGIADKFIDLLKSAFEGFSKGTAIGDPSLKETQVGPLADKAQFKRVMEYLEIGKKDGQLVTGGIQRGKDGLYVEPTIFKDLPNGSRIVQEEVFGPVVTVQTFKTEEDGIKLANDTVFGLSGKSKPLQNQLSGAELSSLHLHELDRSGAARHTRHGGWHDRSQQLVLPCARHAIRWH